MRKIILVIYSLVCFSSCLSVQTHEIWGVWNPGQTSNNIISVDTEAGTFKADRLKEYLMITRVVFGEVPQIVYGSGGYTIKKNIGNTKDTVSLYIEEIQPGFERDERGRREMIAVNAKLIVHFIDENHMWIEIDYNDPEYPTPEWFKSRFFGKSIIYWREKVSAN